MLGNEYVKKPLPFTFIIRPKAFGRILEILYERKEQPSHVRL